MKPLYVVGLGPGHRDYVVPAAWHALNESDVLVGGARNLETVGMPEKRRLEITANLESLIPEIRRFAESARVAVVASGDPGLYGILNVLVRHFGSDALRVIPGVSSVQYLFARIGRSWEDARILSLHGRERDLAAEIAAASKAAIFTDARHSPRHIADILTATGMGERVMYVGSNLSYEHESIERGTAASFAGREGLDPFSVVVIIDERL